MKRFVVEVGPTWEQGNTKFVADSREYRRVEALPKLRLVGSQYVIDGGVA